MLKDLTYFLLLLLVFVVSFGVAFQSLLDPNKSPSWELLGNVLWRPYWQMLGEMFLDDVTEGMGIEVSPRNCTRDRALAKSQPEVYIVCHEWILPVLLGIFMMITNILLLNLLIAIFSKSFDKVEEEAAKFWHYHLYGLYVEYYCQAWLPPPLNLLWYCALILKELVQKCWNKQRNQNSGWICWSQKVQPVDIFQEVKGPTPSPDGLFCLGKEYRNQKMETDAFVKVHLNSFTDSEMKIAYLDQKLDTIKEDLQQLKSALMPDLENK